MPGEGSVQFGLMRRLFRIIDSSDPECWICTGTHSACERGKTVFCPARNRHIKNARKSASSRSSCCYLPGGKTVKTGTLAFTLSRLVQCKPFIIIAIRRCTADSKSADLRVLGVQLPLPAPTFDPFSSRFLPEPGIGSGFKETK